MSLYDVYLGSWSPQVPPEKGYETSDEWCQRKILKLSSVLVAEALTHGAIFAFNIHFVYLAAYCTGRSLVTPYKVISRDIEKLYFEYRNPHREKIIHKVRPRHRNYFSHFQNTKYFHLAAAVATGLFFATVGFAVAGASIIAGYLATTYICHRLAFKNFKKETPLAKVDIDLTGKADDEINAEIAHVKPLEPHQCLNLNLSNSKVTDETLLKYLNRLFGKRYQLVNHKVNLSEASEITYAGMRGILTKYPFIQFDFALTNKQNELYKLALEFPTASINFKDNSLLSIYREKIHTDLNFVFPDGRSLEAHSFLFAAFNMPKPQDKQIKVVGFTYQELNAILEEIYRGELSSVSHTKLQERGLVTTGVYDPNFKANLYNNATYSDYKIIVEGKSIYLNKAILASVSDYFKSAFKFESTSRVCTLDQINPDLVQILLKSVYDGSSQNIPEDRISEILDLIVYFNFNENSQKHYELAFAKRFELDSESITDFLEMARSNSFSLLRNMCNEYLRDHFGFELQVRDGHESLIISDENKFDPSVIFKDGSHNIKEIYIETSDKKENFTDQFKRRFIDFINKSPQVCISCDQVLSFEGFFEINDAHPGIKWRSLFLCRPFFDELCTPIDFKELLGKLSALDQLESLQLGTFGKNTFEFCNLVGSNLKTLNIDIFYCFKDNVNSLVNLLKRNPLLRNIKVSPTLYAQPYLKEKVSIHLVDEQLTRHLQENPYLEDFRTYESLGDVPLATIKSRNLKHLVLPAISQNLSDQCYVDLGKCKNLEVFVANLTTSENIQDMFKQPNLLRTIRINNANLSKRAIEHILSLSPCLELFEISFVDNEDPDLTREFLIDIQAKYPRVNINFSGV